MRVRSIILFFSVLISGTVLSAQNIDSTSVPVAIEAESPSDTLEMSDEDIMKMLESPQQDTVKKVVDRGFDVSRMVNAKRQRAEDHTRFVNTKFIDNTFASVRAKTNKLLSEDYSFGLMGGASFGKWLHEDHAVRLGYSYGKWQDNFDGSSINAMELDASYMFNLSSYVGGYRTNRFCEVMFITGIGYANSFHKKELTHAFSAHFGANFNLRLFKDIDFFIEPAAALYTNGMAVSYAGNWRTWLSAVQTSFGLTYNIKQMQSPDSKELLSRTDGWYVTMFGGPHFQNSHIVYNYVGIGTSLGIHMAVGVGKYYTDFFSFRFSGAFSRGTWVEYSDGKYPCNYFAARAEGILDIVSLLKKSDKDKKDRMPLFAASLVLGPEIGYMHKVDHQLLDHTKKMVIGETYMGLAGGIQFKVRPAKRLGLFLEPRFSLIPYEAPYYDEVSLNDYRNYYDGIFNISFGIEFLL